MIATWWIMLSQLPMPDLGSQGSSSWTVFLTPWTTCSDNVSAAWHTTCGSKIHCTGCPRAGVVPQQGTMVSRWPCTDSRFPNSSSDGVVLHRPPTCLSCATWLFFSCSGTICGTYGKWALRWLDMWSHPCGRQWQAKGWPTCFGLLPSMSRRCSGDAEVERRPSRMMPTCFPPVGGTRPLTLARQRCGCTPHGHLPCLGSPSRLLVLGSPLLFTPAVYIVPHVRTAPQHCHAKPGASWIHPLKQSPSNVHAVLSAALPHVRSQVFTLTAVCMIVAHGTLFRVPFSLPTGEKATVTLLSSVRSVLGHMDAVACASSVVKVIEGMRPSLAYSLAYAAQVTRAQRRPLAAKPLAAAPRAMEATVCAATEALRSCTHSKCMQYHVIAPTQRYILHMRNCEQRACSATPCYIPASLCAGKSCRSHPWARFRWLTCRGRRCRRCVESLTPRYSWVRTVLNWLLPYQPGQTVLNMGFLWRQCGHACCPGPVGTDKSTRPLPSYHRPCASKLSSGPARNCVGRWRLQVMFKAQWPPCWLDADELSSSLRAESIQALRRATLAPDRRPDDVNLKTAGSLSCRLFWPDGFSLVIAPAAHPWLQTSVVYPTLACRTLSCLYSLCGPTAPTVRPRAICSCPGPNSGGGGMIPTLINPHTIPLPQTRGLGLPQGT